jgi:hypothetical protein
MPLADIPESELDAPTWKTVFKLIGHTARLLFKERLGIVLGSSFLLMMVWGSEGKLPLLGMVFPGWRPSCNPRFDAGCVLPRPHAILPVPWDQEWAGFLIGLVLLVGIPMVIIKLVLRERWSDYGLGGPGPGKWRLTILSTVMLFGLTLPLFLAGANDPAMQREYPLYHGTFASLGQFAVYELGYFAFFVVIEFIFRGYLLFGLFHSHRSQVQLGTTALAGRSAFGIYAIFLSMLSYTAWHLAKPVPEAWGTLGWGIAAGAIVLATRTVWPVILVHWLLNVVLDFKIVQRLGGFE